MSIWYQYEVEAMSGDFIAVAKFFNLDPAENVRINNFTFSFGMKNGPGLRLQKLQAAHPDLIFLVEERIECDTVSYWLDKFNKSTDKFQHIYLYTDGPATRRISKKALEEYSKELPSLPAKHIARQKGFEEFRWSMFISFERASRMLNQADEYKEMVILPFNNHLDDGIDDLWSDDCGHLEMDKK